MKKIVILSFLMTFALIILGQKSYTKYDYQKADSISSLFNEKTYHLVNSVNWIKAKHSFWYETKTRNGREFFIVDADQLKKEPAFDAVQLCSILNKETSKEY